jgi:hypothetical protein
VQALLSTSAASVTPVETAPTAANVCEVVDSIFELDHRPAAAAGRQNAGLVVGKRPRSNSGAAEAFHPDRLP